MTTLQILRAHGKRAVQVPGRGRSKPALAATATATQEVVSVVADHLVVPANDQRHYKVVELRNGLQVLLVSDATATAAAAALTVCCGTFQDPRDRLGLAHFHEHMLFLGTEKYPKEDEYNRFLAEHGGDSNAFTMNEYTTYYFKVASPHLEGALDRFAQFFVGPTFDPSCVEREMNAVDSESTNYSTEDGWRLLQVLKATAAEEHPFFHFDVGNLSTLGAGNPDATRERLIEWNHLHYQAGAMRLVIVGKESLSALEKLAVELFSPVRPGSGQKVEHKCLAWPQEKLGRVIQCVPLKESRSISVCWPLPPQRAQLFSKPELYISHILGHEGEGSLHAILNERGWVDQLSAGASQDFADQQLFAINVVLTPEGDEHRDEVLALLFKYVTMVCEQGPQEATHLELKALQEIAFAHKEESPAADDFAASAAMSLHKYPAREAIRGPYALDEWRPDVIQEYLDMFQMEKVIVFQTSKSFEEEATAGDAEAKGWRPETWYGAYYREEPLTKEHLARWVVEGDVGLRLPEPNRFIPQDFSLRGVGPEGSKLPVEVTPPHALLNSPLIRLWHKTDSTFKTPREYVLARIHSPVYRLGPHYVAMMRLFCNVVIDDLNAFAYDASVAGLGYGLDFSDTLSLSVMGFNHKLPELLKVVLGRLEEVLASCEAAGEQEKAGAQLSPRGEELLDRLDTQRQIMLQDYRNFTKEEPWSVSSYYTSQLMMKGSWHLDEYITELEKPPSLGAMAAVVRKALAEVQAEVMLHGNVDSEEAKSVWKMMEDSLKVLGTTGPLPELKRKEVLQLPVGQTTIIEYDLAAQNPAQENCCTQTIYEVGPLGEEPHKAACLAIVSHVGSVSAYQKLRTEEQLGYIVQAGTWRENHVAGLQVLVQGNRLHPQEVDARTEDWLASFHTELQTMSEEEFANNVRAVVSERTQRYSRLSQETFKHWSEIQSRRYKFDRLARGVAALEALSKQDVLQFFEEYFPQGAPSRRKLSVRVLGTSAGDVRSTSTGPILRTLSEIRAFQASGEMLLAPPHEEVPAHLQVS